MKQILFFTIMAIALSSNSQEITLPFKNGKVIYEVIDSTVKGTKEEILGKAKIWVSHSFNDGKSVIEIDDNVNGKLIVKGNSLVPSKLILAPIERMNFTIEFSFKDNKYRIQIYNIDGYPQSVPSLNVTIESLHMTYSKNDYPFKTKGQEKYMSEKKEKDKQTLLNIDNFILSLIESIRTELNKSDDF